ncbi:CehA/McbA family metallohydrolase [Pelagibacterium sp. 26DY04]|uniref:CehA/McbA family metallohydrolase n=1 Tax=Pelagibacterium sp. 26DY04 TaxID=2967130 RepID=UPI0028166230|nr:CehA/McbA family metallohydrolase [Pelagibacterium sp. 26DY04]WMT88434.1 CehA/McbA family metallohydrolase [Pelagibacterium sp. 26DY04]
MSIVFEGLLTLDTMSSHVPHTFTLPPGVETLRARFTHSPTHPGVGDIPHQISVSLYGPAGPRGTRHNNVDQSVWISTRQASPGIVPGAPEPGTWQIEIDVHRILPPGHVSYRLEIDWAQTETFQPVDPLVPLTGQRRRGPGWYRGDLHGHTIHSDGQLSVAEYLQYAVERGYDFVALTDHNTVTGLPELDRRAGEAITIIGGTELTTYNGHALVLGTRELVDWRVRDGETMSGRAEALTDEGKLFVIAHPKAEGHPFCTGCRWAFSDLMPGPARHIEVWNRFWSERTHNEESVYLFYRWLNAGYRMVATAGTDTHRRAATGGRIAANVVYALDNTQDEILAGIRAGRSFISSGPELKLSAQGADGGKAGMGQAMAAGRLTLRCDWAGAGEDGLVAGLIRRGRRIESWTCGEAGAGTFEVEAEDGDWFVCELRDRTAGLHAITNPIHVGTVPDIWR